MRNRAPQLLMVAKGLIGEVFTDEKREAAETYWKILLHVSSRGLKIVAEGAMPAWAYMALLGI